MNKTKFQISDFKFQIKRPSKPANARFEIQNYICPVKHKTIPPQLNLLPDGEKEGMRGSNPANFKFEILNLKLSFFVLALLFFPCLIQGAFDGNGYSARQRALADASATLGGSDAVFSNPACLARVKTRGLSTTYSRLCPLLSDGSNISDGNIGVSLPLKNACAGIGYHTRNLDGLYRESTVALGCGFGLSGDLSAGLNINLLSLSYGKIGYSESNPYFGSNGWEKNAVSVDAGLLLGLSEKVLFGLRLQNANEPDLGLGAACPLERCLTAGISYRGASSVFVCDVSASSGENRLSAGIEQFISVKAFAVRGGVSCNSRNSASLTAGFGWNIGPVSLDYAYSCPLTGIAETDSHIFTLCFSFGARNNP
jgi:hypothetical protein